MAYIYFFIAFSASTIGAMSGIGGGIIIKPVMDAISGLSVSAISFMSGCTVLSMALSSFIRGLKSDIKLNYSVSIWLAFGGALGGCIGKTIFSVSIGNIKLVQAILLFLINIFVYLYIKNKSNIVTLHVQNKPVCFFLGFLLGMVSAFLGVGGGPINISVLSFFFSYSPKVTAKNSLFIILFSQATSFAATLATHTVPEVNIFSLTIMCIGGVAGAIIGSELSKNITDETTEKIFKFLLLGLIALNVYNIYDAWGFSLHGVAFS